MKGRLAVGRRAAGGAHLSSPSVSHYAAGSVVLALVLVHSATPLSTAQLSLLLLISSARSSRSKWELLS